MATVTKPYTFTTGATIVAAEHNSDFDTIYNDYNGNITNVNIASNAAISDSKLAQITTAAKVSGAAFTSLASITSGAGLIPSNNLGNAFSAGMIVIWSGSQASIPTGWSLCNGTSGTPNLTDRFVICAGSTYAVADTGGEATHTLTIAELPAHSHPYNISNDTSTGSAQSLRRGDATASTGNTAATGSDTAHNTLPPYYALCYIMKI